ncbi:MAG: phenylalanine--tRNA ligase subunit alpha [Clostridiales bacterium]|nr:phenylalanine--tRNA ligase subunit alpha [Clostridiales bacterium]
MENKIQEVLNLQITKENVDEIDKKVKNLLKDLYAEMKTIPNEQKREVGAKINEFRTQMEEKIKAIKQSGATNKKGSNIDLTLSKPRLKRGAMHPLNKIYKRFEDYYRSNGYNVVSGPEIELDKYNCEMLNMPPHHPARSMQDTFYIELPNKLLRSHTSAMQVRYMLGHKPPVKIISPGIVYRVDELDPQHTPMFFQLEGLVIGDDITLADLKGSIMNCISSVFGDNIKARFVPCYYPYTEPSAAIDMTCTVCGGKGCRTCKNTGWIRVGGCGMVHPNVLEGVGYKDVQGFAFGYGMSRIPQLEYSLPELRILHDNNIKVYKKLK